MRHLFLFVTLAAVGCGSAARPTGHDPGPPDLDFPVGAFSLTERSGKPVTADDLKGKVWVGSFVFTRCTGPCPAVTATVARLQSELPAADYPDLRFVTFTVDPKRDDLAALRKYAEHFRADPDRWLFLTGDEAAIHTLSADRFRMAAARKDGPEVKAGDEFAHGTRLALVDKAGVIRGLYDGMLDPEYGDKDRFEAGLDRLKAKVKELSAGTK
ncbi:MAG: SCO family protein [Gemmataceae bacterium]|nr:SCO family protein [Gemmataceae bacterium]